MPGWLVIRQRKPEQILWKCNKKKIKIKIPYSGSEQQKWLLCVCPDKDFGQSYTMTTVAAEQRKASSEVRLVSSGNRPWQGGNAQVNRCGLLDLCRACWSFQATHTYTHTQKVSESWLWSSGLRQAFMRQSPKALKPCSDATLLYPFFLSIPVFPFSKSLL